eukprot:scaffold4355_cov207-Alexandrium_tamarense.AAC.10
MKYENKSRKIGRQTLRLVPSSLPSQSLLSSSPDMNWYLKRRAQGFQFYSDAPFTMLSMHDASSSVLLQSHHDGAHYEFKTLSLL